MESISGLACISLRESLVIPIYLLSEGTPVKTILLAMALTTASSISQAATQNVLTLHNDRDANVSRLGVQADAQGAMQKIVYTTPVGNKSFTAKDIAKGAVLEADQGVDAIILTGDAASGKLALKFVYNGLTMVYHSCNMNLTRSTNGDWALSNSAGKAVQNAKLITWGMGITTVEGLCPK
jgi:ethanolamine utilization microcompartment shell protein EutS